MPMPPDLTVPVTASIPNIRPEVLQEIDSTNTELMRRIRMGNSDPTVLLAMHQTAGRGRLGRDWITPPGSALTFSISMPFNPVNWSGLSLAVGVCLANFFDPEYSKNLGLKWPNDLWVWREGQNARKLAGILIETANLPNSIQRHCVVGVGINLHSFNMPNSLIQPIGLSDLGLQAEIGSVFQALTPCLIETLSIFEKLGLNPFIQSFEKRDILLGKHVVLSDNTSGICSGINAEGALLITTDQDAEPVAVFGSEVSVRPV